MKVGIVTIYDLLNYGNRLQNYALARVLENYGIYSETLVINEKSIKKTINCIKALIKGTYRKSVHWNVRQESGEYYNSLNDSDRRKLENCKEFTYKYLHVKHISYIKEFPQKLNNMYDFFITGSDQVWNPSVGQAQDWEFLSFASPEKRISVAASFGRNDIPKEHYLHIQKQIKNMTHVSVREKTAAELVYSMTGKKVDVLIDPTLMINTEEWEGILVKPEETVPEKYILLYFLGGISEAVNKHVSCIAEKFNLKIVDLMNSDLNSNGPAEFLYLIKNANIIMTDSFHACVFSFLFNRPFLVFNRNGEGNNMMSRIDTLLSTFDLKRKYIQNELPANIFECDYTSGLLVLEKEREKVDRFLKKALNCND